MRSEYWETVELIENEIYERAKSQMISNGYLFTVTGEQAVRKTADQYAMEQAAARGALDIIHNLKTFRQNLLELLKEDSEENDDDDN